MSTGELIDTVVRSGGILKLQGDSVKCWLPKAIAHLAGELKEHKPELVALLRAQGRHIATFPHCPKCASHYLYRESNVGNYECMTCGMAGIREHVARRVM